MEFHDLGKHCSAENCNQQDFLPFTCNGCTHVFCSAHRTHADHDCAKANFNDKRVLECSLCSKVLKSQPGLSRDVILQRHVASGCMEGLRKARPNKLRCAAPGCRGSEFVKVSCRSCNKNFCFRHRHEDDHTCEASTPQPAVAGASRGRADASRRVAGAASAAGSVVVMGSNGRGCGVEAREATSRRAAAAEGRRAVGNAKPVGGGGTSIKAN